MFFQFIDDTVHDAFNGTSAQSGICHCQCGFNCQRFSDCLHNTFFSTTLRKTASWICIGAVVVTLLILMFPLGNHIYEAMKESVSKSKEKRLENS